MYKIGDKLKCSFDMYKSGDFLKCIVFYDIGVRVGATYQIQTLDNNKSRVTFLDDELDTRSIEISRLNKYFKKVENKSNKVKNQNSKHYELWHDLEAIDVIKTSLNEDEYVGFLKGNILKYQLRLGKKDNVEKEIEKIKDYQNELNMILIGDKSKT